MYVIVFQLSAAITVIFIKPTTLVFQLSPDSEATISKLSPSEIIITPSHFLTSASKCIFCGRRETIVFQITVLTNTIHM